MDDEFDPARFPPPKRTEPCRLYLISPHDVGGGFAERLKSVADNEIVAAFQLRVKDVSEHELARLAEPLQRICADAGVSFIVNDSMQLAKRLYVAFGAFYPTTTKPSPYRPDPSILSWWSSVFEIPCVAIGGINPANAKPLVDAGADFLAVCQAVWSAGNPTQVLVEFRNLLAKS